MKTNYFLFLCLLIGVILTVNFNCVNCRQPKRQQQQPEYDEDEFSEFDNIEDESTETKTKRSQSSTQASSQQQQQHQQQQKDDFSSFDDETIEDEDEDERSVNTKKASSSKQTKPDNSKKEKSNQQQQQQQSTQLNEDLDMEEFEHFVDDEEFEGFDSNPYSKSKESTASPSASSKDKSQKSKSQDSKSMPSLKIADVPTHLISNGNWQNYVYEIVMIVIIFFYFAVFIYGKSKNYRLVNAWYQANRDLLEKNFALVGDDGSSTEIPTQPQTEIGTLIKESENSYGLWCSGRTGCDGLLVQLKLIKRQDLINGFIMQLIKPQADQIIFSVDYPTRDEIDSFVFCLTNKKTSQQMYNDYQDIGSYCSEKKTLLSNSNSFADLLNTSVINKYVLFNEIGEVPNYVLDKTICNFLNKYPDLIEYLLISDQYVGFKSQLADDQSTASPTTAPETPTNLPLNSVGIPKSRSVLIVCFNIPGRGLNTTNEDMESMIPALQLALYLIDKVPRIRLSKEAKVKAIKKRKDISEQFMKLTHKQRQEAAMLRREEKRRAEKEKIMNESDPEKQKKLEEKDLKKEKKRIYQK